MRARKERFALKMKDNVEVRRIEDLRKYFELGRILDYFGDGTLTKWLELWYYTEEAEKVSKLDKSAANFHDQLCEALGVDTEDMKWRRERLNRLKQFTTDPNILQKVDNVAFDSEDLYDILDEDQVTEIYLCNNEFNFPSGVLRKKNRHYHGIGNVKVIINSDTAIDFKSLGITFDDKIKFDDKYNQLMPKKGSTTINLTGMSIENIIKLAGKALNDKNTAVAIKYYEVAANRGSNKAKKILQRLKSKER